MFQKFKEFRLIFKILLIFGGVILAALLAFLFGFIVMLLWNWLMPDIFGLKEITYWQAWGLVVLAHILFKAGKWGDNDKKKQTCKEPKNVDENDSDPEREKEWKRKLKEKIEGQFEEETTGEAMREDDNNNDN